MSSIPSSGNHIYTERLRVRQNHDRQTVWETQVDNKDDKHLVSSLTLLAETKAQRPGRLFLKPIGPWPVDQPDKFKVRSGHACPNIVDSSTSLILLKLIRNN